MLRTKFTHSLFILFFLYSASAAATEISTLMPMVKGLNGEEFFSAGKQECDQKAGLGKECSGNPQTQSAAINQCKQCVQKAQQCAQTIDGGKEYVGKEIASASATSAGSGAAATSAGSVAVDGSTNQETMQDKRSKLAGSGANLQAMNQAAAQRVSQAGGQCAKKIAEACQEFQSAKDYQDVCTAIAARANAIATEKGMSGLEMMQMANMGLGALGQLKSLMGGKDGGGGDKSGISGSAPLTTSNLGGSTKSRINGSGFNTSSGGASKTGEVGINDTGAGAGYTASSKDFSSKYGSGFNGSGSGISAPGEAGVAGTGGAAGSSSSSGASKMPSGDALAAAKAAGGEAASAADLAALDSGGGSGYKSNFLGLKSSKSEFGDLMKEDPKTMLLGDKQAGERGLASVDGEGGNDVNADSETDLFQLMHLKVREIKKRGLL